MHTRQVLAAAVALILAANLAVVAARSGPQTSPAVAASGAGDAVRQTRPAALADTSPPSAGSGKATASPSPSTPVSPTPSASAARSAAAAGPTPASVNPRLRARLAELVRSAEVPRSALSVAVTDGDGDRVYAHRAGRGLLPASTTKLVTAAGALATFGADHRYTTELRATAGPDGSGTLAGELVLVGGGDPTLATPAFASMEEDRPRTPLEDLAEAVAAAGIQRVTGGVVADPGVFADEPLAPGWKPVYLEDLDATPITGLTINAGRTLSGRPGDLSADAAASPPREAAAALVRLLEDRGVALEGSVRVQREPPRTQVALASVTSAPLRELLSYMLRESDNHIADTVFRTVGAEAGEPTWAGAASATVEALGPLGLDWETAVLADGSGLSRRDRLSAGLLVGLHQRMSRSRLRLTWQRLMAVTGETGTLEERLTGTPAAGIVRGKTGSLGDVRALAGTVLGPGDEHYQFAVLANRLNDAATTAASRLQDEVLLALVAELYDCQRTPVTPPRSEQETPGASGSDDPGKHSYELDCSA
jgi:D-alanyl-D-alanine carboxypeptidase/D-alanyl-D-alanine-endopeptidase (penicillin-binding protein 4)